MHAPGQRTHGSYGEVQAGSIDPITGDREMENASYHQVTASGIYTERFAKSVPNL
jgi:hypothetical protein